MDQSSGQAGCLVKSRRYSAGSVWFSVASSCVCAVFLLALRINRYKTQRSCGFVDRCFTATKDRGLDHRSNSLCRFCGLCASAVESNLVHQPPRRHGEHKVAGRNPLTQRKPDSSDRARGCPIRSFRLRFRDAYERNIRSAKRRTFRRNESMLSCFIPSLNTSSRAM